MLSVFLIFLYMFITATSLGGALISLLIKKENIRFLHPEDAVMLGLMIVTVYAQFFSLFAKVGLWANIILLGLCAVSLILTRKKLSLKALLWGLKKRPLIWCALAIVTLVMIYGTSAGYMHYDSDLYHAQAIRWIEEYGVVKGLGNLHSRLAYNSSSFALTALYSFSWITGRSYHACAGFMALIVLFECLRALPKLIKRDVRTSDFIRFGGIYYILSIYDEMVSPESDYFAFLMLFFVVIRMVELAEAKVEDADVYAVFSMIAFCLVTIKLSVAMIVLVSVVPIVLLAKQKRYSRIVFYAAIGLAIVLPFIIRGVILSGYMLYPSTMLDVFNVDWKVPKYISKIDSDFIVAYGRGYDYVDGAYYPLRKWLPHWISLLGKTELCLMAACLMGVVYFCITLLIRKKQFILQCVEASMIVVFFSWFLTAPLVRYAQGILICLGCLMLGDAFTSIIDNIKASTLFKAKAKAIITLLVFAAFAYKGLQLTKYIITSKIWNGYTINQQDYTKYDMMSYKIGDFTIYTSTEGDATGYDPFPAVPAINTDVHPRGKSLSEGFYIP